MSLELKNIITIIIIEHFSQVHQLCMDERLHIPSLTPQRHLAQLRRLRLRAFLMATHGLASHRRPRNHTHLICTIPADLIGLIAEWVALSDQDFYDEDKQTNK